VALSENVIQHGKVLRCNFVDRQIKMISIREFGCILPCMNPESWSATSKYFPDTAQPNAGAPGLYVDVPALQAVTPKVVKPEQYTVP